jgi:hypothetical protein
MPELAAALIMALVEERDKAMALAVLPPPKDDDD